MVVDEHCHVKGIVTRKVWKKRGCRQWGGGGASRARCAGWREDVVPDHAADLHPPCRICWGPASAMHS